MWNQLGMSSIWISWRPTLAWSCLCQEVMGRGGKVERAGSFAWLVIASTTKLSSHSAVAYLENFKQSGEKRKKKAFKSVPLSSKLQPCIFNFLSPYNVIHWHPSQTWAPAACIALQDKLSSHAVATCQEHRGVTEKMHSLMLSWEVCEVGEKKRGERTNRD